MSFLSVIFFIDEISNVPKILYIVVLLSADGFEITNSIFSYERMNEDVYVMPNVWKIYTVSYMHYSTIGTIIGITVGLAISLLFPTDQDIDPKLLTPFVRKLMYPDYKANNKRNGTKVDDLYVPVSQVDTKL